MYSLNDSGKPPKKREVAPRPLARDALTTRSYSVQEQLIRQQARVQTIQALVSLFLIVAIVAVLVRMAQANYSYDVGQKAPPSFFATGRAR